MVDRFVDRAWYEFCRLTILWAGTLVFRLRYTGVANIPSSGPVLLAANHQSYLDPPLIGVGCPRPINAVARQGLFRFAPFARLIRSVGAFPIDSEGVGIAGIKETLRRLRDGKVVLIFPEGSRTPDNELKPFLPGFTALALRSGATVVPTAIEGAFDAWPRCRRLPRPETIHVHFGPPMTAEECRKYDERELVIRVEEEVRRCSAELRKRPVFKKRRRVVCPD